MTKTSETNKAARDELRAIDEQIKTLIARQNVLLALVGKRGPNMGAAYTPPAASTASIVAKANAKAADRMSAADRVPTIVDYLRKNGGQIRTARLAEALGWHYSSVANALDIAAAEDKIRVYDRTSSGWPREVGYKATKVRPGEDVKG